MSKNTKALIFFILFFLIASASFALGYIYANNFESTPIIIEDNSK